MVRWGNLKVRVICSYCGKSIFLDVPKNKLKHDKGGIYRVATLHNCNGEEKVVLVFLDNDLSVRGKEICPLVSSTETE